MRKRDWFALGAVFVLGYVCVFLWWREPMAVVASLVMVAACFIYRRTL